MRLKMMAGLAALCGFAAIASAAPPAPPAPGADPAPPEPKLICKRISDRPSDRLAPRRKVCMTAEQWKEARRTQAVEMPRQQAPSTSY